MFRQKKNWIVKYTYVMLEHRAKRNKGIYDDGLQDTTNLMLFRQLMKAKVGEGQRVRVLNLDRAQS